MADKKSKKKSILAGSQPTSSSSLFAIVRVKGNVNIRRDIKDTLQMLRLKAVNNCSIFPVNDSVKGMLQKVGNYVTWGEVDKAVLEKLVSKRGRVQGDKKPDEKTAKEVTKKIEDSGSLKNLEIKPVFKLSPPSKGYISVKSRYPDGDAGYRGVKINELLEKMI